VSDNQMLVRIEGLTETRRAFLKVDRALPKMLRLEANEAARGIVQGAQRKRTRLWRDRSGKTTRSIRARSTQAKARVLFGGTRFPWARGQEFGSYRNNYKQFTPWSGPPPGGGAGSRGHFLWPAVREGLGEFRDAMKAGVERVAREAALRTRGF
jgi:hypothetical protein